MEKITKVIFATGNKEKLKEVRAIFNGSGIEILSPEMFGDLHDIEETGTTFKENAFIKAREIFDKFGIPTVADDSGLVVEQLNGEPGIFSARYAGKNCTFADNNKKLISELKSFPKPHSAKFVCIAVFISKEIIFDVSGELPGSIISEYRGSNGFGYDPIFIPDGFDLTLAELTLEEKNRISHRAQAFNKIKNKLRKIGI